jgi:hypothetical protein
MTNASQSRIELDLIRQKLCRIDLLLDQGLIAINQGRKLEAMEDVYGASCLLEDLQAVLGIPTQGVAASTAQRQNL